MIVRHVPILRRLRSLQLPRSYLVTSSDLDRGSAITTVKTSHSSIQDKFAYHVIPDQTRVWACPNHNKAQSSVLPLSDQKLGGSVFLVVASTLTTSR